MALWVPPAEHARRAESQRVETARALQHVEATERVRYYNRELQKIDRYTEVFKALPNANYPGVKPGYWHILRRPPVGQPTFIVHETPDGGYRDLDAGIFQALRDGDMWNAERQRDRDKMIRAAQRAEERQSEREREARIDEVLDRAKAAWNPGVSFANAGMGWSYRAGKAKG